MSTLGKPVTENVVNFSLNHPNQRGGSVYIPSFRFSFFYFMIENRKKVPKYPFLFS